MNQGENEAGAVQAAEVAPRRFSRRWKLSMACGSAAVLATTAAAWACTPVIDQVEPVHKIIHDVPHGSFAASQFLNLEVLGAVSGARGMTYSVHQDDDGIKHGGVVRPRVQYVDGFGVSCSPNGDPVVGQMVYDSTSQGTGTATVTPLQGPGVYEICTGPNYLEIRGYITFW